MYNYKPFLDIANQNHKIQYLIEFGDLQISSDEGMQAQLVIFNMAYNFIDDLKTNLK